MSYLEQRFNDKYIPVTESGCWIWVGTLSTDGYPSIWLNGKMERAHRVAFKLFKGDPKNFVCHSCDVPQCVNPDHLFDGTHDDNMRDMRSKNRGDSNKIKLTVEQVKEVRRSKESNESLAKKFGVHKTTIWKAKTSRTWGHL